MKSPDRLAGSVLEKPEINEMSVAELRRLARRLQIGQPSKLRKALLVQLIRQTLKQGIGSIEEGQHEELAVRQVAAYWLEVTWTLSAKTVARAAGSLKGEWHRARMVLRLHAVECDDSGPHGREHVCDILLPDGVSQWFVEIDHRALAWQLELGYITESGRFFTALHSPDVEVNLSERLQASRVTSQNNSLKKDASPDQNLVLGLNGQLALVGQVVPASMVTINGELVPLDQLTWTFRWSDTLENGRKLIPVCVENQGRRLRVVVTVDSNVQYLELEKPNPHS